MLLPIRTNIRPYRTPYTNYALIAVNILIFLLSYKLGGDTNTREQMVDPLRSWTNAFVLTSQRPHLWQYISYAFLHGSFLHIAGNMFFLYLFGNNVNDKLGNVAYLCFYLGGAVFSGVGHTLISSSPVLGASGAIAAVTGAFLVLFPQTSITVLYWFFFIGTMELSALFFIGFKMIFFDNLIARTTPMVAYDAHLAGYAFGILVIIALLATRLIEGSSVDLWSMVRQWNRRRQYRTVVASGYDPFGGRISRKIVKSRELKKSPAQQEQEEKIGELRRRISSLLSSGNITTAAEMYLELEQMDSHQILPRQQLLDIANQQMAAGNWGDSARTYEKFLSHYSNYEYVEQVQLMLGILYSRYLHKAEAAIKYLEAAQDKLTNPAQQKMCSEELSRLRG
ncbi:MAG: rhomboid family intramembrane serine protease [Planctomycetota bacterium]